MSVGMERSVHETGRRQAKLAAIRLAVLAASAELQLSVVREVARRYICLRDEVYADAAEEFAALDDLTRVLRRVV